MVQLEGGLQTIDPLLGGIHRGAHPHPVCCIVLIGFQQVRKQFTRPGLVPLTKGFYGFLENCIAISHTPILPYS